ncbi:MAG: Rhodanese-related sulfurtransferase [Firmicutes bacterium]|nr:Rhodanese-related sulfurtransferase [Bacillota bacterium]
MKDRYRYVIMATCTVAVLFFFLLSCTSSVISSANIFDQSADPVAQQVSIDEAMEAWRNKEVVFIDVRTPEEYQEGHVPGAILIPLAELEKRQDEVTKDKRVFLICRSGNRSAKANVILQKYGYVNTYSVAGGMMKWQEAVEK